MSLGRRGVRVRVRVRVRARARVRVRVRVRVRIRHQRRVGEDYREALRVAVRAYPPSAARAPRAAALARGAGGRVHLERPPRLPLLEQRVAALLER